MTDLSAAATAPRGSGTYDDPFIVDGRIKTTDAEGNEIHLAIRAPAPLTDDPSVDRSDVSASAKLAHQIHQAQQSTADDVEALGKVVTAMNGVVDGISKAVSSLSGTVGSLSTSVSELSGSVQGITDKIESGEIGGGGSGTSDGSNPNVLAPAIISPPADAEDVQLYPVLKAGPYRNAFTSDARANRIFQIAPQGEDWDSDTVIEYSVNADEVNVNQPLIPETGYRWRCRDVSSYGLKSAWSEEISFTTGPAISLIQPVITVERGPDQVLENPLYTGSEAAMNQGGVSVSHDYTVWTLYAVTDGVRGEQLWTSGNDSTNLTSIRQPKGYLQVTGSYEIACQYHDAVYGLSPEAVTRFTCAEQFVYVQKPTLALTGAPENVPQRPFATTSAFTVVNGEDTHKETVWHLTLEDGTEVTTETSSSALEKWQLPSLTKNTAYKLWCEHIGTECGPSESSDVLSFRTMEEFEGDSGTPDMTGFGQGPCPRQDVLDKLNLEPMPGCDEPGNANWGPYKEKTTGSIFVYLIPFWIYVGTDPTGAHADLGEDYATAVPYYTYPDEESAAADGYYLLPGFKNGGKIQGVFRGLYIGSKSGTKLVSVKNAQPCTESNANLMQYARNMGDGYFMESLQVRAIITAISYLVGIHGNPAWKDATGTMNFPKGNNNSGRDYNDSSVTFPQSSSPKTGMGTPYAKTTHNGEECGIPDVAGCYYQWHLGMTTPTEGFQNNKVYILKPSVDITTCTFDTSAATDLFGTKAHLLTMYDEVTLPNAGQSTRWGNASAPSLHRSTDADRALAFMVPRQGGVSSNGTNRYGQDQAYLTSIEPSLVPCSAGHWYYGSGAGVFYRDLDFSRGDGGNDSAACVAAYGQ